MLKISKDLRKKVISIIQKNKRGHIGPAFSLIEILWSIYNTDFYFNSHSKFFHLRDRVILSKGHGCLALYAVLNEKGILPDDALASFCEFESILGGHPERRIEYGIEASTGSLGHGLSLGVGIAKSHQIKKNVDSKVFVILGDGELNEGSVWESAMSASKHSLKNLILLIDYNKMQAYGDSQEVMKLDPLDEKWKSFGFDIHEVDGHSIKELQSTIKKVREKKNPCPTVIICHTTKGYGVDFMHNNPVWHHKSNITEDEFKKIDSTLSK